MLAVGGASDEGKTLRDILNIPLQKSLDTVIFYYSKYIYYNFNAIKSIDKSIRAVVNIIGYAFLDRFYKPHCLYTRLYESGKPINKEG